MSNKMLIDAVHPDEARVAILHDNELYDYDFVTASKSQIKGNIYLAKITRVEPSLQAAFVEYGGGRQGFLPFSEIHPDYYHMPVSDKQKLLEEQILEAEAEAAEEEEAFEREQAAREARAKRRKRRPERLGGDDADEENDDDLELDDELDEDEEAVDDASEQEAMAESTQSDDQAPSTPQYMAEKQNDFTVRSEVEPAANSNTAEAQEQPVSVLASLPEPEPFNLAASFLAQESTTDENADLSSGTNIEETDSTPETAQEDSNTETEEDGEENTDENKKRRGGRSKSLAFYRRYKIQEVIKRNQVVLIQVTKEERGNKGCSLTTYISLAGRYCVLMPNSPKGGGISRKITDRETRRRLKQIAGELRASRSMSVIIRTAGIDRAQEEIGRDYEYLVKLWNKIREETLASTAPALIYEEGNLIKRAIRDLYTSDIETIEIEGNEAYKEATSFMQLLLPTHEHKVKHYKGAMRIFTHHGVDEELEELLQPQVRLPSGGYLIINPTEALISIDVNSGKSTTERNVEETAVKTNLEAAREVARQMRLRDLAGLLVVDFIDMNYGKHRRQVERAMRDAVRGDRAKIQLGRISNFGLMELSRQRMRPSLSEALGIPCPHCKGAGVIHAPETVAFQIIRTLEKEAASGEYKTLRVSAPQEVALKLLNEKRDLLYKIETNYHVTITVLVDISIVTASFRLIKLTLDGKEVAHDHAHSPKKRKRREDNAKRSAKKRSKQSASGVTMDDAFDGTSNNDVGDADTGTENGASEEEAQNASEEATDGQTTKPRKRRGGRRGGRRNNANTSSPESGTSTEEVAPKKSERGGRNRRRRNSPRNESASESGDDDGVASISEPVLAYGSASSEMAAEAETMQHGSFGNGSNIIALREVSRHISNAPGALPDTDEDPEKPKRKGWWSRVLEK